MNKLNIKQVMQYLQIWSVADLCELESKYHFKIDNGEYCPLVILGVMEVMGINSNELRSIIKDNLK